MVSMVDMKCNFVLICNENFVEYGFYLIIVKGFLNLIGCLFWIKIFLIILDLGVGMWFMVFMVLMINIVWFLLIWFFLEMNVVVFGWGER